MLQNWNFNYTYATLGIYSFTREFNRNIQSVRHKIESRDHTCKNTTTSIEEGTEHLLWTVLQFAKSLST